MNDFNDIPFDDDPFIKSLSYKASVKRLPFSATFELTHRCNFDCKMCYVKMKENVASLFGKVKSADEWLDMGRRIRDAGVLTLILTGGECLSFPDFDKLYTELHKMGFLLILMTNGSLMNGEYEKLFAKYPPYKVHLSLYGASADTYGKINKNPDGFEKTLNGIRAFKNFCKKTSLNFPLTKENINDYPEMAEIAKSFYLPFRQSAIADTHRCGAEFSNITEVRLSPTQSAFLNYFDYKEYFLRAEQMEKIENKIAAEGIIGIPREKPVEKPRCKASYMAAAITWNGEMRACISMRGYFVNPFETGFEAAWERLSASSDIMFGLNEKCKTCGYCDLCRCCPARTVPDGSLGTKTNDYICEYTYAEYLLRGELETEKTSMA